MTTSESLIICTAQKHSLLSPHPAQRCEQSEPKHLKHNSQLCKIMSHGPILTITRLYFDSSPAPDHSVGSVRVRCGDPEAEGLHPEPAAQLLFRGAREGSGARQPPHRCCSPPPGQGAQPRGGTSARARDGPGQAGQGGQVGNGSKRRLPEAEGTT